MPQYFRQNRLLLWITIACLSVKTATADVTGYGMRIHPPRSVGNPQPQSCATCFNKTASIKLQEVDLRAHIKQESTAEKPLVKQSNAKTSSFYYTAKPLVKVQQTASPAYSEPPKDNPKRGATFFFTQVEPHRFEYRAMFQHERNTPSNVFQPFVHDFDAFSKEFPPLPKFPTFPEFPNFFPEHKDPFPNFKEFSFPTLPPAIKRASWEPQDEAIPPKPILDEKFNNPLARDYDLVLGHTRYPKIFRFNEERVNIEDFDRQKKLRFYNLATKEQNELLEPENVKRDQLLILHGGVFTIQEPPLFSKRQHVKKRRKNRFGLYQPRL